MSDSRAETAADRPTALFDRYTLPKVALTVILAASLVGVWLTTTLHGRWGVPVVLAKWAYLVALGVLTGGLVWKHLFVRPADLGTGAADYCADMYARFDRIALGAVAVATVGGLAVVHGYLVAFDRPALVAGYAAAVACSLASVATTARGSDPIERQFRSAAGLVALGSALLVVVATAVAEAATRGFDPVVAGVRVLHLSAFAVWIGGAVWNIFVAVPTGQRRSTVAVVRAAGEQLERFRWAVRFIIPTLLVTGAFQAVEAFGTSVAWYLGTAVGGAVLAKFGAVCLLVVIFLLCPMWRACSPIEGVCELDDLGSDEVTIDD
jgi:putative copper resistance protein D